MRDIIRQVLKNLLFENSSELEERRTPYTSDQIFTKLDSYDNFGQFKKKHRLLYKRIENDPKLQYNDKYIEYYKAKYDRLLYLYIWKPENNVKKKAGCIQNKIVVYFGLTCNEDSRYNQHIDATPDSLGGNKSSINEYIQKCGYFDIYRQVSDYVPAKQAVNDERCLIDYYKTKKDEYHVLNKIGGGGLGGCRGVTRSIINDVNQIAKSDKPKIKNEKDFKREFPELYKYYSSKPKSKRIFNQKMGVEIFKGVEKTFNDLILLSKEFNTVEDFVSEYSDEIKKLDRPINFEILYPESKYYQNVDTGDKFNSLKDAINSLDNNYSSNLGNTFLNLYYDFERDSSLDNDVILNSELPIALLPKNKEFSKLEQNLTETRKIIKRVLKEESGDDKLISYFIKKWNKGKNSDGKPTFNPDEIKKLGLMKHFNKIRLGFIDYYEKNIGNPVDDILKELTETTFTTDDIKKLGIDVGGYDFKFDIEDILTYDAIDKGSFGKIRIYARIKEGTVTTIMNDNRTFDLTDEKNAEKEKYWHEVEYEVEDLISLFIEKKLLSYGFNLDDLDLFVYMYKDKGSLNEAKMLAKNKFAKAWLSKYNDLKKYKSEDGRFIYLANDNGSIIVSLDTQLNETAVSYELIWSMLERHFTEKETRRKIIGWLLDQYHLTDMGYVYDESQDMMGKIDSSDTLIESRQITESQEKNQLKDYFFKKWTKQKEEGKLPKLSFKEIKGLGLKKYMNEIIVYYSEFMNLDPNDTNRRTEIIKNYLLNNTFDENDITEMKNSFDDGKIKVRFSKVEFSENEDQVKNYINLDIEFLVLSGSFYNQTENQTVNFSSTENPFDDFVQYFEFKEVIEHIVESFIFELIESFGFNINNDIDYISVKW